ncbi:unnamed protein product [Brassica oleracea]
MRNGIITHAAKCKSFFNSYLTNKPPSHVILQFNIMII